jgi:hypothetical protein
MRDPEPLLAHFLGAMLEQARRRLAVRTEHRGRPDVDLSGRLDLDRPIRAAACFEIGEALDVAMETRLGPRSQTTEPPRGERAPGHGSTLAGRVRARPRRGVRCSRHGLARPRRKRLDPAAS